MDRPGRSPDIERLYGASAVRAYTAPVSAELIDELHRDERSAVEAMVASRRAEFATARACARSALADLGIAGPIVRGAGGEPRWPHGVTGSISHTRGFCVAVATADSLAVGIDVEEVDRMSPAVERRVLVDAERAGTDGLADPARRARVATIFAAKESFYKAHYMVDPRYIGFDAVTVTVEDTTVRFGPASGAVDADLLSTSVGSVLFDAGRVVVGVTIGLTGSGRPLPSSR